MSPPLVVAFALAGRVTIDLTTGAARRGAGRAGRFISRTSGRRCRKSATPCRPRSSRRCSAGSTAISPRRIRSGTKSPSSAGQVYEWDAAEHLHPGAAVLRRTSACSPASSPKSKARGRWAFLATASPPTTSRPAGSIKKTSPAGKYLIEHGVNFVDFNSYGSRRGNDRVMTRGTFANVRIKNLMVPGVEGGVTQVPARRRADEHLRRRR